MLIQLQEKSRLRKKERLLVVEGRREIDLAIRGGYRMHSLYICPDHLSPEELEHMESVGHNLSLVTSEIYRKIAYRSSTEGIIGIFHQKDLQLEQLVFRNKSPLILVAEAPEKPGNIGALLRTADAAAVDAVIIANPRTDLYNPNTIRSSVGCLFTVQLATGTTTDIIRYLKNKNIALYGAALQAAVPYNEVDYTESSAIVIGTEATGLSQEWLKHTDQNIVIPMSGEIDSMNLSVAAGILIFEARRQRGFSTWKK